MPGVRRPCLVGSSVVTAPGAQGAASGEGGGDGGGGGPGPARPGSPFAVPMDLQRVASSENTSPASRWPGCGAARGLLGRDEEARPRPGCGASWGQGLAHWPLRAFYSLPCLPVVGDFLFEKVSNFACSVRKLWKSSSHGSMSHACPLSMAERAHVRPPRWCFQVGVHARDFTHLESALTQTGGEG